MRGRRAGVGSASFSRRAALPATAAERTRFILEHTTLAAPQLLPELQLHLADKAIPLWEATEVLEAKTGLPPPYWAFCWAGGQALTRYLLDRPELVQGKRVLDFAAGCGVTAIGMARAGATSVLATEIDDLALLAMRLNAEANGVQIDARNEDVIDTDAGWDVVVAGDVCYEKPMAERVQRWLAALAKRGAVVLMGDPGRNYLPTSGLEPVAHYTVRTSLELENRTERVTRIFRFVA